VYVLPQAHDSVGAAGWEGREYRVEELVRDKLNHQGSIRCMLRVGDEVLGFRLSALGFCSAAPGSAREGLLVTVCPPVYAGVLRLQCMPGMEEPACEGVRACVRACVGASGLRGVGGCSCTHVCDTPRHAMAQPRAPVSVPRPCACVRVCSRACARACSCACACACRAKRSGPGATAAKSSHGGRHALHRMQRAPGRWSRRSRRRSARM
jgi:hypothetical protein